jgi:CrcB protein
MDAAMTAVWIFMGGGLGSVARWAVSNWVARSAGGHFPWGTLAVNVSGSFVIGALAALTNPEGRWAAPLAARQFFLVGICGGYTTFSSFSIQTFALAQEGQWFRAGANILASVALCLVGVWLGHTLASLVAPTAR